MPKKAEKTVQQRIKAEKNRLNRIFKDAEKSVRDIARPLIDNAAFMSITCEDLAAAIAENGVTAEYKNGKDQYGTKKSPEVETYNSMIKNLTGIIAALARMTPEGSTAADELLEYLGAKKSRFTPTSKPPGGAS